MKFFSGFTNRFLICVFLGIVLLYVLESKNFDLHFILRGPQQVSSEILIIQVPADHTSIQEAITEIKKHSPQLIVAPVNRRGTSLLGATAGVITIPRKSLRADEDGFIRSLSIPLALLHKVRAPHHADPQQTTFINFRGPANTFPSLYFYELKNQKVLPSTLYKKIIIFDIQDADEEPLATPVGELSPAELIANILDNLMYARWISPLPFGLSSLLILLTTALLSFLILSLSANLAFVGLFVLLVFLNSLGFFLFDHFYTWLPLTAYTAHIFVSYFIFINYKLNKKEHLAWRLEKEKIYQTEMDEMKKNFLNLFSHDLKTPIAKILAQIEILEGEPGHGERIREGLGKMRRYSNELNQYVKNILKISQIEANRFQLRLEPCDINVLIQNAVQNIKPLADEKGLSLLTELEPLFSLNCDKELVQQIILNILENAVKYSPDNRKIFISSVEDNDFVVVSIKDEGKGIRLEEKDLIWKKFSRFDDKTEGSGLGLYLVKYFVEAHNGVVFVESTEGSGTTIGFKLPLKTN